MERQPHSDPHLAAWEASFYDENHLNFATSPDLVASPAQVRFMIDLPEDGKYYPCPVQVYQEIMARIKSPILGAMYSDIWKRIYDMVVALVDDDKERTFLVDLLNIKHQNETANFNIIPGRLEKRLFKLFLMTTQIEDPMREDKLEKNRRAWEAYTDETFSRLVNRFPGLCEDGQDDSLEAVRRRLDAAKLLRLLQASVAGRAVAAGPQGATEADWARVLDRPATGNGWEELESFLLTPRQDLLGYWVPRRILYLASEAGEIVFDLAVIKFLIRLGHTVILSVKNAAYLDYVYFGDIISDPILRDLCRHAEVLSGTRMSKNELSDHLKNDKPFKIITDGTMEPLNLLRVSVTFSRVFKEVDAVIAKGADLRTLLIDGPFSFTRDLFVLSPDAGGALAVDYRPRSNRTPHFTSSELEEKAEVIVAEMRKAREQGQTVMFYSGIVGSIPGETATAITVMTTFVEDLKRQQADIFVVNPSAYFEKGMDADDLMYMWEIVQRSGYIDIWRFQTVQDIEKSFALQGKKVPRTWAGKDATYSTGCTKERLIAADVQKQNPEMQIIGPDLEKFFRRSEYGIGLFHDTRLTEI